MDQSVEEFTNLLTTKLRQFAQRTGSDPAAINEHTNPHDEVAHFDSLTAHEFALEIEEELGVRLDKWCPFVDGKAAKALTVSQTALSLYTKLNGGNSVEAA